MQIDIQSCDASGDVACSNLPNGTDITNTTDGDSNLAPEGGIAAAIKVRVDSVSGEGDVEVVCGASGR